MDSTILSNHSAESGSLEIFCLQWREVPLTV